MASGKSPRKMGANPPIQGDDRDTDSLAELLNGVANAFSEKRQIRENQIKDLERLAATLSEPASRDLNREIRRLKSQIFDDIACAFLNADLPEIRHPKGKKPRCSSSRAKAKHSIWGSQVALIMANNGSGMNLKVVARLLALINQ